MPSCAASSLIDVRDLRLDTAHTLAVQAGADDAALRSLPPVQYVQSLIDELCELSLQDPLTGLANRRYFESVLEQEMDRVSRSGESALLLMMDIDYFKRINDSYGHVAGDKVLQSVARILATCVRPMDTLARYGGEEFAVVLPTCQIAFGTMVAERIRRAVAQTPIRVSATQELHITISVGGAYAMPWIRSTPRLWIERADQQLYLAKSGGRNCVRIEAQPDSTVSAEEKSLLFGPPFENSGWGSLPAADSASSA
ncbi:GGDEF domain-containing protein [Extensimonas vulgaris]|uniref:diguanylate cyclase n=1 Tax=Extensimonas vulgaris TaxID=1031594 RepID=A0A369AQI8_9BURK|nr:GGDEF domain-containing protein [Extensimonas vulgaris]RCX09724.1 diguanylate cyclase (GGDEF)-like protein [Extensimonas vulgaris]TWI39354.1 diguanylate cyclase (GGDEF)-like protein [Extensimonas vulgaris]TXD15604.1 GGDEF domain-containing protein [Extensimonas vulgaris]